MKDDGAGWVSAYAGRYRDGWIVVRSYPRRADVLVCKMDKLTAVSRVSTFSGVEPKARAIRDARLLRRYDRPDPRKGKTPR